MRIPLLFVGFTFVLVTSAMAQVAREPRPAGSLDEPVPRAERAKARQDCLAEHVALSGEDLRQAMRECIQAKFPDVQLYARNGVTRDGRPTVHAVRAACKAEVDAGGVTGAARREALTRCFSARRPDLAQRAACRREGRGQGLDGEALREAVTKCAREARS